MTQQIVWLCEGVTKPADIDRLKSQVRDRGFYINGFIVSDARHYEQSTVRIVVDYSDRSPLVPQYLANIETALEHETGVRPVRQSQGNSES